MASESREFTFYWKINNYSLCQLKNGEFIDSPIICTDNMKDFAKWHLTLYPQGVDKESEAFVVCFLYRVPKCGIDISSKACSLDIIEPGDYISASTPKTSLEEGGRVSHKLIAINKLKNEMKNWKNDALEIYCQLFDTNYKGKPATYEAQTDILVKEYLFNWDINIAEFQDWNKGVTCHFEERSSVDICMTTSNDRIYLKIQNPNNKNLSDLWKMKISILIKEGVDIGLENSTCSSESSEFETSFEKSKLESRNSLTFMYSFKLLCDVKFSNGTITSTFVFCSYENTRGDDFQQLAIPRLSLQKDLQNMLLDNEHSDFKLHAENEIIPVHKCILSARSPVFSAMFKRDMTESRTGIVDIPDVEIEVLRSFVNFIYTDTFPNTDFDHLLKLMLLADKYQVDILKVGCSQLLMPKISVYNVCEVISVADLVNQVNLKHFSLKYIKAYKMTILDSPDWSEWVKKNMILAIEILTKLSID